MGESVQRKLQSAPNAGNETTSAPGVVKIYAIAVDTSRIDPSRGRPQPKLAKRAFHHLHILQVGARRDGNWQQVLELGR
jgi:hypothetical protein